METESKRILIFTGEGKGKTTAALGMVLRAHGHGLKVAIIHFVKGRKNVGEVLALTQIDGIDQFVGGLGFLPHTESPEFQEHKDAAISSLRHAKDLLLGQLYDMVVLDEVCWAIHKELISEDEVISLFDLMKMNSSLVLTGRFASRRIIEYADTVTEMRSIKHGFQQGIPAQIGIEK